MAPLERLLRPPSPFVLHPLPSSTTGTGRWTTRRSHFRPFCATMSLRQYPPPSIVEAAAGIRNSDWHGFLHKALLKEWTATFDFSSSQRFGRTVPRLAAKMLPTLLR